MQYQNNNKKHDKYSNKNARKSDQDIQLSKKLSYLLRHGAEKEGLNIGSDGYVKLADMLARKDFQGVTVEKIEKIVQNCEKQRFQLTEKDQSGLYIRASQGQSIKSINEEELLQQIQDPDQYPLAVHGTFYKFWDMIKDSGLKIMGRNHVHFSIGFPGDNQVISGMRGTCQVFIEIDIKKAMQDGMKFFISNNSVILSSGFQGVISPQYFRLVKDKSGKTLFANDGNTFNNNTNQQKQIQQQQQMTDEQQQQQWDSKSQNQKQ